MDLAGRYENYSDAGDALAGKIAARYALNDTVGIRGSVSNSFRAPSLAQTAFQFSSTSFGTGGALTTVRTVAPGSAIGRALGAGIATKISCHSFRATGITTYLQNGGKLEIEWREDGHVLMTGPVSHVFEGRLSAEFLASVPA